MDRVDERRKRLPLAVTAFEIGARLDGVRRRMDHVRSVVVPGEYVRDGSTIAPHVAVELPRPAQMIAQKHDIRTSRGSIDRVIGAHHRLCMRLGYRGPKCGQVAIPKIGWRKF